MRPAPTMPTVLFCPGRAAEQQGASEAGTPGQKSGCGGVPGQRWPPAHTCTRPCRSTPQPPSPPERHAYKCPSRLVTRTLPCALKPLVVNSSRSHLQQAAHKERGQPALVEPRPHELVALHHAPRRRESQGQRQLGGRLRQHACMVGCATVCSSVCRWLAWSVAILMVQRQHPPFFQHARGTAKMPTPPSGDGSSKPSQRCGQLASSMAAPPQACSAALEQPSPPSPYGAAAGPLQPHPPGVLPTGMPRLVASGTTTLLKPTA